MGDNRQIIVICSNPGLDLKVVAGSILAEFNAARFLDYLGMNSALDQLCEGIICPVEEKSEAGSTAVASGCSHFGTHHAFRQFVNGIKLVSFRAENMMAGIIRECAPHNNVTCILKDLLSNPADLVPDIRHQTLMIRLHPQVYDGYEVPLRHLCSELTLTETVFPGSDLRLVYGLATQCDFLT
jgi:hypothetical protein